MGQVILWIKKKTFSIQLMYPYDYWMAVFQLQMKITLMNLQEIANHFERLERNHTIPCYAIVL